MSNIAIEAINVSKSFRIWHEHRIGIAQHAKNNESQERVIVADKISFVVNSGDIFGIIGKNGSGKTTLLKMISGIYQVEEGILKINGSLIPLLEIGAGFQKELSAVENIITYGLILGLKKKEISSKVDSILRFAELEQFADTPLKKFSSGMQSRLALATATQIEPDIMLVDETLAVGDISFRAKCYENFARLKEKGKTIVLVSHKIDDIIKFCNKAMYLEGGKIVMTGEPSQVVEAYKKSFGVK